MSENQHCYSSTSIHEFVYVRLSVAIINIYKIAFLLINEFQFFLLLIYSLLFVTFKLEIKKEHCFSILSMHLKFAETMQCPRTRKAPVHCCQTVNSNIYITSDPNKFFCFIWSIYVRFKNCLCSITTTTTSTL